MEVEDVQVQIQSYLCRLGVKNLEEIAKTLGCSDEDTKEKKRKGLVRFVKEQLKVIKAAKMEHLEELSQIMEHTPVWPPLEAVDEKSVRLGKLRVLCKKAYKPLEVVDTVVRSINPGMRLRSYLEGLESLTLPCLRCILRSHYQQKSVTELYHQLFISVQKPQEGSQSFAGPWIPGRRSCFLQRRQTLN